LRRELLARYARYNVALPTSSFLRNAHDRLAIRHTPGGHYVEVKLSRRNHKEVRSPKATEEKLWKFLKKNVVDERRQRILKDNCDRVHCIEMRSEGKAGVVVNGQPVRVESWFQYDIYRELVGKVERIFVVTFGSRFSTAGREVIVYIRRFKKTVPRDDTDFDVDTGSNTTLDVVPLKSLCRYLWAVERSDATVSNNAQYLRLLLVKEL
jgi:hypothetical protein